MAATPAQVAQLAAGAHSGTAGVQAYNDAQAQVAQSRDAAISGLKATAAQAGAPGALTAQLAAGLAQPASVALANLGEMGGVARSAQDSQNAAQSTYMQEASAALPLVRAEADRDLGQKIALLNASKSGGGGRATGAASLSDSELRNRLLGMATSIRQQQIGDLEHKYLLELGATKQPGPIAGGTQQLDGHSVRGGSGPGFAAAQNLGEARTQAYQQALTDLQNERVSINQKTNASYGPGLAGEAQQLGLQAGIDPARVYGVLTPQDDAAYVAANKKLGLYKDPSTQEYTGSVLDPAQAAKKLGMTDEQARQVFGTSYLNFGNPRVDSTFSAWANRTDPQGTRYGSGVATNPNSGATTIQFTDQGLAQARRDFQGSTTGRQLSSNLLADTVRAGVAAAKSGIDLTTWANMMTPEERGYYQANPDVLRFAAAQLQPVFAYYQALRTRQAAIPDATSAGVPDPSTATALGLSG